MRARRGVVTTTGDTTYDNNDLDDANFRSFVQFFRSFVRFFRSFEQFSKNRSRRCDDFGPKIVKIGAILAIFRPLK